jgi:hypothetical protein
MSPSMRWKPAKHEFRECLWTKLEEKRLRSNPLFHCRRRRDGNLDGARGGGARAALEVFEKTAQTANSKFVRLEKFRKV